MSPAATIVTGRKQVADAIRRCVPNPVLEVDSRFIDLADPGFNEDLEPQFRVLNPEAQKALRELRGEVVCAIPPGLSEGNLMLHLAHTLHNSPVVLLHAALHDLSPDGVARAIKGAEAINPWLLTSVAALSLTEHLVRMQVVTALRERGLAWTGWQSLFYLHLARAISNPSWTRHLRFGTCTAVEIDPFGGTVYHCRYPRHVKGGFAVTHKEAPAEWPDRRFAVNRLLWNSKERLEKCMEEMEQAYFSGAGSWPFSYGGVNYGEQPVRILSRPTGLLQHLAPSRPSRKVVRIYQQDHLRFRSQSYYPEGQPAINPLPAKAQIQVTIDPLLPDNTLQTFLGRLEGCQLNLDFASILQLIHCGYVGQGAGTITITPKGEAVLDCAEKAGLTGWRLYLILRLLENIQTDESSYEAVLRQIQETVQDQCAPSPPQPPTPKPMLRNRA